MLVNLLQTSSKGNSCLIKLGNKNIIIDVGISNKKFNELLESHNVSIDDIDAILVTHSHIDHTYGLEVLKKRHNIDVYMTHECALDLNPSYKYNIIDGIFNIDDILIEPFILSHDAYTVGYKITYDNKTLVYATDTGYVNNDLIESISNKDVYVIESNYDVEMILHSKRHPDNVRRVLSDRGHLSNYDCSYLLSNYLIGDNTKAVILAHLSNDHNTEDIAINTLKEALKEKNKEFSDIYAKESIVDIGEVLV